MPRATGTSSMARPVFRLLRGYLKGCQSQIATVQYGRMPSSFTPVQWYKWKSNSYLSFWTSSSSHPLMHHKQVTNELGFSSRYLAPLWPAIVLKHKHWVNVHLPIKYFPSTEEQVKLSLKNPAAIKHFNYEMQRPMLICVWYTFGKKTRQHVY